MSEHDAARTILVTSENGQVGYEQTRTLQGLGTLDLSRRGVLRKR